MRLSADGDREAFGVFMDRHVDPVHRFLVSLGAEPADVEDALQECFVSAWKSAGGFRAEASARSWLFTIARNALRRQHRTRAGEPDTLDALEELGARAGWGTSQPFDRSFEIRDELRWMLGRLPEEEREVVVLRDLEGFSGAEAAEMLGLTLAATKSRLHRGRLRLMSILRSEEEGDA